MLTERDLRNVFVTYDAEGQYSALSSLSSASPPAGCLPLGSRPEHGGVAVPDAKLGSDDSGMFVEFGKALAEIKNAQGPEYLPGILRTPDHAMGAALQSFLSISASSEMTRPLPSGIGQEVPIDDHDYPGWIRSFFTWYKGIRKHPWLPLPSAIEKLPNIARVAVLGDWGTGLYGAPKIAALIDQDRRGYDLAIHLGDVYYSGLHEEVQQRFLQVWPTKPRVSRALNSNHEMYTGGYGYFDLTLPTFHQQSSVFASTNDHFILVGLDTGYEEHKLAHEQAGWLDGLVASAGSRKVILFTHHQPFSLMEKQGSKLVQQLGRLLEQQRIFAWYWGHEHRCIVYDRHEKWQLRGRLVGHGGYPYFRTGLVDSVLELSVGTESTWRRLPGRDCCPSGLLLDGPNPFVLHAPHRYGPNGWVTLEFNGPQVTEVYYNAEGEVLLQQPLE